MHIPDGYLSPETCAVLYATSTPFWYVALRRLKGVLNTRLLPLISVMSAFSFVIMMFNLPLPGGTTGHAVGVGVATVVLGPWASMLAISTALVIQALFFGDGGVTAIGANCFNMAILGSITAYGTYRVLAHGSSIDSRRRVFAAAIAGYAALNVSALFAAVEFGIQPLFFHDTAGTPLYCPYPLSISIPAMMIGHMTFAGLAEMLVTAGVVAYLQKADPALLRQTAPDAPDQLLGLADDKEGIQATWPTLRRLWVFLGVLLVLTPLGILAAGSAWGEWTARELTDPETRQQIAKVSANQMPPSQAPRGLEHLSSFWTAPLSRYAPSFIRSTSFGYIVSATVGVGLIFLVLLAVTWLSARVADRESRSLSKRNRLRRSFVERTIRSLVEAREHSIYADALAQSPGLLQTLDPRVKVAGLACLVIAAAAVHRIEALVSLFFVALLAAVASHISLKALSQKIWIPVLAFSGLIAIPAIFLTQGFVLYRLPLLNFPITQQGLRTSSILILRAETATTFSALLVLTTEWARVLRALRFFRIPVTAVAILEMTYRYIFVLLRTAYEMFESRQSRLVGTLEDKERRRLAAASVGVLLSKSFQLSNDVHSAMRSRGFQGEIYLLDELAIRTRDWLLIGVSASVAVIALVLGR